MKYKITYVQQFRDEEPSLKFYKLNSDNQNQAVFDFGNLMGCITMGSAVTTKIISIDEVE